MNDIPTERLMALGARVLYMGGSYRDVRSAMERSLGFILPNDVVNLLLVGARMIARYK